MRLFPTVAFGVACLAAAAHAAGTTPEENYRRKCSSCHDAGSAGAPKFGDKAQWSRRNRQGTPALYAAALKGVPNTAMIPKGGFTELSDDEVEAIVDYLLARAGQKFREPAAAAAATAHAPAPAKPSEKVDDETLLARVKATLAKTRGISANDIKPEAADGVVTLKGVVDNAAQIKIAENAVLKTKGVQRIDSKLIPKDLFAWD